MLTEGYGDSAGDFAANGMSALFSARIPTNSGEASLFFIGLVVIYAIAYLHKSEDHNFAMYMMFALWADFLIFVTTNPYWVVYAEPFILIFALCGKDINNKLLMELGANLGMIVVMLMRYPWVYGGEKNFGYLVLKKVVENSIAEEKSVQVAGFFFKLGLERYSSVFSAVFVACLIVLLGIGYKNLKDSGEAKEEINKWHFIARGAIPYLWIIASLGAMVASISNRG
jgi:hypothetical protein